MEGEEKVKVEELGNKEEENKNEDEDEEKVVKEDEG